MARAGDDVQRRSPRLLGHLDMPGRRAQPILRTACDEYRHVQRTHHVALIGSLPQRLNSGARVQLTGICSVLVDSDRTPRSFRLLLRDADDVVILAAGPARALGPRTPWWAWVSLVLALAFIAALGPGLEHAVVAIALTSWPPIARLARAETLSLRKADFVVAVELQGASSTRIILRHIVPMCMSSVIIRLTMNMAGIILTAAALGFLGLGAQAPSPEWGAMISTGRRYMLECWWLVAVPGAAIMLVSLAFNLLGDGLRDILGPRSE